MKVALSIPDDLFESAEALSKRLGVSRSRLYATALAEYVAKHRSRKTTERLDADYATEDSRPDAVTRRLQNRFHLDRVVVVERGDLRWAELRAAEGSEPGFRCVRYAC